MEHSISGTSITIMAGLTAGAIPVLLMIPVLYAIFYRVRPEPTAPDAPAAAIARPAE